MPDDTIVGGSRITAVLQGKTDTSAANEELKTLKTNSSGVLKTEVSTADPVETLDGPLTATTQTSVTVGATSTEILPANANRKGFLITNRGPTSVFLAFGAAATTAHGHELKTDGEASGGALTGAINGITSSGTQDVQVTEIVGA